MERTVEVLSLSKAAEEVKKSKSTIFNYIKTGKLKAYKNGSIYEIDKNDLYEASSKEQVKTNVNEHKNTRTNDVEIARYEEKIIGLENLLLEVREDRDQLRMQNREINDTNRIMASRLALLGNDAPIHNQVIKPKSKLSWLWIVVSMTLVIVGYLITKYLYI